MVSVTRSKNKVSGSFRLKFSIYMLFLKAIPTSGARLYDLRQAQTELTLSAKFQKLLPEKLQIYIFFFFFFLLFNVLRLSPGRVRVLESICISDLILAAIDHWAT